MRCPGSGAPPPRGPGAREPLAVGGCRPGGAHLRCDGKAAPLPRPGPPRIALLAGTAEARAVAALLAAEGVDALASLSGATREPAALPIPARSGGFGGEAPFADWLRDEGIGAILDATHPFATAMAHRAVRVARRLGLPHRRLLRPGWTERPGDRWTRIGREEEAAAVIPPGATVFLATGPGTVGRFAGLDASLVCRRIDPPEEPFPLAGRWLVGRPPFTVEGEVALLTDLRVDWIVARDAGGAGSRPKLDAARALGLPVALIDRPPQPPGPHATSPEEAMAWIRALRPA